MWTRQIQISHFWTHYMIHSRLIVRNRVESIRFLTGQCDRCHVVDAPVAGSDFSFTQQRFLCESPAKFRSFPLSHIAHPNPSLWKGSQLAQKLRGVQENRRWKYRDFKELWSFAISCYIPPFEDATMPLNKLFHLHGWRWILYCTGVNRVFMASLWLLAKLLELV